jgi:hypothetical protein
VVLESPIAQGSPTKEQRQQEDHDIKDKANEEHPPPSNTLVKRMYHDADEGGVLQGRSSGPHRQASGSIGALGHHHHPSYRIKDVQHPRRVEFKAITEIFLYQHQGPTFIASRSNAVADAAWQSIISWVRINKSWLQNSVHLLLPYKKKDQFKACGVKKDAPRMEMVHHQDVIVELSTHLLAAQREIETLHIQL